MICPYCNEPQADVDDHYADCKEAPDLVVYQGRAERRARTGGRLAPVKASETVAISLDKAELHYRNLIDRGEDYAPLKGEEVR